MRYALGAFLIYIVLVPVAQAATSKDAISYSYTHLGATYAIQPDSSVKAEEEIGVAFVGTYHSMWRSIQVGRAAVSDVEVIDADTGVVLTPAPFEGFAKDPNDPSNTGTFAWAVRQGVLDIEWYYTAADTTKHWLVRYTLRGVVEFGRESDSFSWSLFSRYLVPVGSSTVTVILPGAADISGELTAATGTLSRPDDHSITFDIGRVPADSGGVSFVARWPKDVVHPPVHAFFLTEMAVRYGLWVLAIPVLMFIAFMCAAGYWFYKRRKGGDNKQGDR